MMIALKHKLKCHADGGREGEPPSQALHRILGKGLRNVVRLLVGIVAFSGVAKAADTSAKGPWRGAPLLSSRVGVGAVVDAAFPRWVSLSGIRSR